MKNTIMFIGRVDLSGEMNDGQTVKTRLVFQHLCQSFGMDCIKLVETKDYRNRPFTVLRSFLCGLFACDVIIVMLSKNGRKYFFPLLAMASRYLGKRVLHCVIGGSLLDETTTNPKMINCLNEFDINWVESESLVDGMNAVGVNNAAYLPNFKDISVISDDELAPFCSIPWKFCTFSRVTKHKGIGDAALAVERLNQAGLSCVLDVYGPVDPSYQEDFNILLESSPHVSYRGSVPTNESVSIIKRYAAMLFPTTWPSEGMPGSVIDSLSAGVPVLAYRWAYYDEMLLEGKTGLSCDASPDCLVHIIQRFCSFSADAQLEMKRSCIADAQQYDSQIVMCDVVQRIDFVMGRKEEE